MYLHFWRINDDDDDDDDMKISAMTHLGSCSTGILASTASGSGALKNTAKTVITLTTTRQ